MITKKLPFNYFPQQNNRATQSEQFFSVLTFFKKTIAKHTFIVYNTQAS